ncbi:MarR family transcriptional regulator [Clostridium felsineum]|uniref:MarR family winged helix-turn-helix transcriptional regulator n=1 Tax=Clostridium felsineum TaxID=36839 RepID=UPI00098CAF0F|nr:MarR family transcriptional regulator [Clostridium felsineum]MCR3760824.1 MarR family transcriptional regulator [Clostridium felsineum]URZ03351.1 hypothetical protein CLAUR_033970 [Clostridium felsineum]URZ14660.1 hypothetical protein CLFE_006570 [Clostridium felsineum DSM 794]
MNKQEKVENIIKYRKEINVLIHERYHSLSKKYGLSLEQFHLLIELEELMLEVEDKLIAPTVGDIAKNIKNSPNTVSERITRLENKGLVKRVRDGKDKRISRVFLTDEGEKLIEKMDKEASVKFLFDSLSKMGEEDLNNLFKGLSILIDKMKG